MTAHDEEVVAPEAKRPRSIASVATTAAGSSDVNDDGYGGAGTGDVWDELDAILKTASSHQDGTVPAGQPDPPSPVSVASSGKHGAASTPQMPPLDKAVATVVNAVPLTEGNLRVFTDVLEKAGAMAEERLRKSEPTEELTAEATPFEKAGSTGEFDIRGAVGQKFQRQMKAGEHPGYSEMTRDQKRAYREQWAKTSFAHMVKTKTYTKNYQVVDDDWGEYMTLGAAITHYGGYQWQPAIDGAKAMATRCMMLGGRWTYVDKHQSGLRFFLVMKKAHRERFEEAWSMLRQATTDSLGARTTAIADSGAAASSADGDEGNQAGNGDAGNKTGKGKGRQAEAAGADITNVKAGTKNGGGQAPKSKAKAKAQATKKGGTPPTPNDKGGDASEKNKVLLAKATKVKTLISKTIAAAKRLLSTIETSTAHSWAHNPQNHGLLQKAVADLDASMSPFHNEFMLTDGKLVKQRVGPHVFREELTSFINLKTKVGEVSDLQKSIVKMHKVKLKRG